MINEKYYFLVKTGVDINVTYPTLWHGYLKYKRQNDDPIQWLDLDNILVDICNINFYIDIDDEHIHISLDRDENYYAHQFDTHIKKVIKQIEERLLIKILEGEFYANEVKHNGSQYKYNIICNTDKIILKKTILNWEILNKGNDKSSNKKSKPNSIDESTIKSNNESINEHKDTSKDTSKDTNECKNNSINEHKNTNEHKDTNEIINQISKMKI
jgi:hypothetical protein